MKVILQLVESWGPGGTETVVLDLCKRMDHQLFCPVVGLLHDGWLNQELVKAGIETIIINNKYPYDPLFLFQLVKIIRRRNVSVIHSHEFMMNVYGTAASLLTGCPNIVTIHGKKYYWEKWRRKIAYRLLSHFATRIVTVSEMLKKFVVEKTGILNDRIMTVHNGVDCEKFKGPDLESMTSSLFTGSGPIIGTIGNPYPVKGQLYLLEAAAKIKEHFPQVIFLIIGKKTKYLEELQKETSRLNLRKNILYLGFRQDIPELLYNMDIFVLPSLEETFSIATIEAMACSKPVVATRCGGPEEIVVDGKTGFLVPVRDPDALAEKILFLLGDRDTADAMGRAGRQRVEKYFSIDSMINSYSRLYDDLKA